MTDKEKQLAAQAQKEYMRKYRTENRERLREYHREWRNSNPEKVKASYERYWLRKATENSK